ncbi:putative synaptotagmin-15 isoform X2, partial [Apostichopus japonicus]
SSSVVVLASVCGAAVLAALVFLLYRVYRRRCRGRSKYERLGGIGRGVNFKMPPPPSVQIDGKSLSTPSVSLKTVPFTLPPAPVQRERIGDSPFRRHPPPAKRFSTSH